MGFGTRKPDTSNEQPKAQDKEEKWLQENEFEDAYYLAISGKLGRCENCKCRARTKFLNEEGLCPDCREGGTDEE